MTEEVTDAMIDAGARYLRETQQAGKRLTAWEETPRATKKKWLALSEGTLRSASNSPTTDGEVSEPKLVPLTPGETEAVFIERAEQRHASDHYGSLAVTNPRAASVDDPETAKESE